MNHITLGVICGLAFGLLDVLGMIPVKFETKGKKIEAVFGAFSERFMIGFLIPNVNLGISPILTGGIIGLGLSISSSILARIYIPINVIGLIGGLIIGYISGKF